MRVPRRPRSSSLNNDETETKQKLKKTEEELSHLRNLYYTLVLDNEKLRQENDLHRFRVTRETWLEKELSDAQFRLAVRDAEAWEREEFRVQFQDAIWK